MAGQTIEISVQQPSGIPRKRCPLTCGVPFPEGLLRDVNGLRLESGSGEGIPLQVARTASWPDGSVKWTLLDFQVDLEPTERKLLNLRFGEGINREAEPPHPLRVEDREGSIFVDAGPLSFEVTSGGRHPFRTFRFNGADMLQDEVPMLDLEVEDRRYVASDPDSKVFVEEHGPLRAVVRCEGKYVAEDGSKLLDYIFRIYAYAGKPFIRLYHTFVNKEPVEKLEISELSLHLPLRLSGKTERFLLGTADHYRPFRVHRALEVALARADHFVRRNILTPEGFALKLSSLRRNYLAPGESDFITEPLAYLAEKTKDKSYLELAYLNFKQALIARDPVHNPGHPATEEYRFWLPFLDYADRAGILEDLKPC